MASKQPWRSDLTSDLKFMPLTTYATMFVWTDLVVLKLFLHLFRKKKKKLNLSLLDLSASPHVKTQVEKWKRDEKIEICLNH